MVADRLLELGVQRVHGLLHGDLDQIVRNLRIVSVSAEHEILPAGDGRIQPPSGEGDVHALIPNDRVERLKPLMKTLLAEGLYSDDIVVIQGGSPKGASRRSSPYYLIEVPRCNVQILICEETSQATFISRGMIPREEFFKLSKESLQAKYSNEITRLLWRSEEHWTGAIRDALKQELRPKINITDRESFVTQIKQQFNAELWVGLTKRNILALRVDNRSLPEIARKVFGWETFSLTTENHLALGAEIYGSNDSTIKAAQERLAGARKVQADPEYAKQSLREAFHDIPTFLSATSFMRRNTKVHGVGLKAIGGLILGRTMNVNSSSDWTALGKVLWPEKIAAIDEVERPIDLIKNLKLKGIEYIKEEFKKQIPTAGQLLQSVDDSSMIKIDGVGITAIAGLLGIDGSRYNSKADLIKLGLEVFGAEDPTLIEYSKVYKALDDKDALKDLLKERISADQWIKMSRADILGYRLADISLLTIYHIMSDNSQSRSISPEQWIQLGNKVHGESVLQEAVADSKNRLVSEIIQTYPSADAFLDLSLRKIRSGDARLVGSMGNESLFQTLVTGFQLGATIQRSDQIALASILYPDSSDKIDQASETLEYRQKLTKDRDFLIGELKTLYSDRAAWNNLSYPSRKAFKLAGFGITQLHSMLFGSSFRTGEDRVNLIWSRIGDVVWDSQN